MPTPALLRLALEADLILSSDAPRAVASAQGLAGPGEIVLSPLLRELELEPLALPVCLPLPGWALLVGCRTLLGSLRGQALSQAESSRVAQASSWLAGLARQHRLVLAVTHASFRKSLAGELVRAGWSQAPGRRSLRPWSHWTLARDESSALPDSSRP